MLESVRDKASAIQARAADPGNWAILLANAGSGKTKVLTDRVARLLLRREDGREGAAPDSILCITYTKAAANEMLSRLFSKLGAWAVMPDALLREELAALEGAKARRYTPSDLQAARRLFARALETPGGLRIETIHAFCVRVLQRFPLEAGVVPGFAQIEEDESWQLWERARSEAILAAQSAAPEALRTLALMGGHEGAERPLDLLFYKRTEALRAAAACGYELGALTAAWRSILNAPDVSPAEYLAFEMGEALPRDALKALLPALQSSKAKTTDTETAKIIESTLETADPEARWETYRTLAFTDGDKVRGKNVFTKGIAEGTRLTELLGIVPEAGSEILRIQKIERELAALRVVEATGALFAVGLRALENYTRHKQARGALDFEDLVEKTRELLTRSGLSGWVLYKLDGGLSHILLDEAQDTSPSQWELIRALTEEFYSGKGVERQQEPRTLFIVGDEKQSIYSFQGADPSKLREQVRFYQSRIEDLPVEAMPMSFRSVPQVLNFVDAVWNSAPPLTQAPTAAQAPASANLIKHDVAREQEQGLVELWPVDSPIETEEAPDAWAHPVNAMAYTAPKAALVRKLAQSIRAMLDAGETIWTRDNGVRRQRAVEPQDILILLRDRTSGLFDAMIAALKAERLPVAGADRLNLLDHLGVQDCLNLMRFALLPSRDLVLAEILRGPFIGLVDDDRYLFALAHGRKAARETLWDRVQASVDENVQAHLPFLRDLIAHQNLPPFEFLSRVLDRPDRSGLTGWMKLMSRLKGPVRDPVESLLQRALQSDEDKPSSLQTFVATLELQAIEIKRDLEAPAGEIRVMTIHGAKGLEAPVVILPDTTRPEKSDTRALHDVDAHLLWSPGKGADPPQVAAARAEAHLKQAEEFRRLLYVALTRAQDRLIIAGAWHGGTRSQTGYDKSSWYALCLRAMESLGVTPDADGVQRFGALPARATDPAGSAQTDAPLPSFVSRAAPPETSPFRLTAPTEMVAPKTQVVQPFSAARQARLRRGELIHLLLQVLPEHSDGARAEAGARLLAAQADLAPSARDEMLAAALGVLNDAATRSLFAPGGRAEAAVIGTSPKLPGGVIINGRVDRLIVSPDVVRVVDFKTDQPPPGRAEDVAPAYLAQMAAYAAVLETAYPGRRIEAFLCWTEGPRLMRLPEALLEAALKNDISAAI